MGNPTNLCYTHYSSACNPGSPYADGVTSALQHNCTDWKGADNDFVSSLALTFATDTCHGRLAGKCVRNKQRENPPLCLFNSSSVSNVVEATTSNRGQALLKLL